MKISLSLFIFDRLSSYRSVWLSVYLKVSHISLSSTDGLAHHIQKTYEYSLHRSQWNSSLRVCWIWVLLSKLYKELFVSLLFILLYKGAFLLHVSYEKWILPTLLCFVLLLLLVSLSFFFGVLLFVRVVSLHISPPNIYTMDIQLMGCSYDIDWFVLCCFGSILVSFVLFLHDVSLCIVSFYQDTHCIANFLL